MVSSFAHGTRYKRHKKRFVIGVESQLHDIYSLPYVQ